MAPARDGSERLQAHWRSAGELRQQFQFAAHSFDEIPQGRNPHVTACLDFRYRVLADLQPPRDRRLRLSDGLSKTAQRQLFGDELLRPSLDLLALALRKARNDLIQRPRHSRLHYFRFG
jgi:hypothetical protein